MRLTSMWVSGQAECEIAQVLTINKTFGSLEMFLAAILKYKVFLVSS